jgi:hypothetical protein
MLPMRLDTQLYQSLITTCAYATAHQTLKYNIACAHDAVASFTVSHSSYTTSVMMRMLLRACALHEVGVARMRIKQCCDMF